MTRPIKEKAYDNCSAIDPDGNHLFNCPKKKADWYLQRGLAEISTHDPLVIRLLFRPNGCGWTGDDYHLQPMKNQCVVCGTKYDLTKHHVVPYQYKIELIKKFNLEEYLHEFHDILVCCIKCHNSYERKYAKQLKEEMVKEFNAPIDGWPQTKIDRTIHKAKLAAAAILKHGSKIPADRIKELENKITAYLGKEPTYEEIERVTQLNPNPVSEGWKSHGKLVVEKITDPQQFVARWRKHFVDFTKPKFMPANWNINRTIFLDRCYARSSSSNNASRAAS